MPFKTYEGNPVRRKVTLLPKNKMHGTSCAIRIEPDGSVHAQSKTQDLTPQDDYKGFAAWLEPQKEIWSSLRADKPITIYGEWAGPRIAKGTAIQRTDQIRFFVFLIGYGAVADPRREGTTIAEWVITCPKAITNMMPADIDQDRVRVLPYEDTLYEFDFASEYALGHTLKELNHKVDLLEARDPYVARTFGVEGPGEGYVLTPYADEFGQLSGNDFSRLAFKAKTEKHRVQKQKKPAAPREPLPNDAIEFLDTFVTEARLDQAIEEAADGKADRKATGAIIAWMTADIEKEGQPEIQALAIPFSRLKGDISKATREMFFNRLAE